jgi:hypothetical protein
MLTPLQNAQSTAAVSAMQSIVETIEDRRRQDAEKANPVRKDEVLQQAHLSSDDTARQANARINDHFFGSNARNGDTLAKLISRFSDALGATQQEGETGRAFAQRLSDLLVLVDAVRLPETSDGSQVTLGALGTTLSSVKGAMTGASDDAAANLVARLALASGVTQGETEADGDFGQRLSAMLTRLRGELPADTRKLEARAGLADLGLKATDLVAAIRNPYGLEAERVKDALAEKAKDEKALTPEMRKVLARLEDTAKPKTTDELKAERTQRDPTRVEDAETRAEREETIAKLEAGEKLEDVRELQEAIRDANGTPARDEPADTKNEKPLDPADKALETIQLLSAGTEATELEGKATTGAGRRSDAAETGPADTTGEATRDLDAAGIREQQEREEAKKAIFALRVDDNGIYDLITRQLVA